MLRFMLGWVLLFVCALGIVCALFGCSAKEFSCDDCVLLCGVGAEGFRPAPDVTCEQFCVDEDYCESLEEAIGNQTACWKQCPCELETDMSERCVQCIERLRDSGQCTY